MLNLDLLVYFRLHSHGSGPTVFGVSLGQPCSINPHSQDCTMTNICRNQALQLLIKTRNSGSKTSRGWQTLFHLLPSLPYCVFPPLSKKISLWGRFFSSIFLKELLKATGSFRSCFYGTERTHESTVSLKIFLSLLSSNQRIFSNGFSLGGPMVCDAQLDVYMFSLWDCASSVKRICMYLWTFLGWWDFILTGDGGDLKPLPSSYLCEWSYIYAWFKTWN